MRIVQKYLLSLVITFGLFAPVWADPTVTKIGADLYAYISDNDGSSNATFLVGQKGILVVDTGLDAKEGTKLLRAIQRVSSLPVLFVVNTHYHPDHSPRLGPGLVPVPAEC